MAKELTYKDAGVNLDLAADFKKQIEHHLRRTFGPLVMDNMGGFGGLYSLHGDGKLFQKRAKKPVLVAGADGVGTKVKIAFMMDKHDTVGIDLVAMSVNDILVQGAEPLFFLDYIATGELDEHRQLDIVKGIADGCEMAECALLGGETAQMPDMYRKGEYDLAGFAVGLVEAGRLIDGRRAEPGDVLVGLESSGIHSNGYSLVRKVFFERQKMKVTDTIAELGMSVGEALLRPTRVYVRAVKAVLRHYRVKHVVKGIAHITGGGLVENVPRVLPKNCDAVIRKKSWTVPPIFDVIRKFGSVPRDEMDRVFNMGIGMVLIVSPFYADSIISQLARLDQPAHIIGEIKPGSGTVQFA
ncbi:MAG: phosphoribosylformylglycinamidine cyclo-ligase [Planctomycetes bacterium]|nr:phosphoribosylformylglycinamidine cyclo-ligase [Planctomycetota bacterium]